MVLRHDRLGLAVGCQKVFETNFPSLGPPWRSHPYIEGCSLRQMVHAVSLGRSSSRYRLDCRPAEWLMVYVTGLCCQSLRDAFFESRTAIKVPSLY